MNKPWNEQRVAVTGAASGIGAALCARFVALEAQVLGLDLNADALEQTRQRLGPRFLPLPCDVTRVDDVARVFAGQEVDVLINSAGITGKTNVKSHDTDPDDVERVFRVNFFGSYYTSRAVLPGMARRGYGRVLHIASIAGKEGNAGMIAY